MKEICAALGEWYDPFKGSPKTPVSDVLDNDDRELTPLEIILRAIDENPHLAEEQKEHPSLAARREEERSTRDKDEKGKPPE